MVVGQSRRPAPYGTLKTEQDDFDFAETILDAKAASIMPATKGVWWMPWRRGPKKGVVGPRKAPGSCLTSFDPGVPEWGNPPGVMPGHPRDAGGKWGN